VFGGTFDPVHIGHLRMANELASYLSLDKVYLMPCFRAVHKQGVGASSEHRLNMLALALESDNSIALDNRESQRDQASYTIDSLQELRQEVGCEPLCLVMGTDVAKGLASWLRIDEFSKLTNIIVIRRPDEQYSGLDKERMLEQSLEALSFSPAATVEDIKMASAGKYIMINLTALEVSSSHIRKSVKQGLSIRYLVTDAVREYICDNALYQN